MEAKKGMDKETRELTETGEEINKIFEFVKSSMDYQRLTAGRLIQFESYLRRTETIHPLIAPMEAKKTFKAIDIARKRVSIVITIMKQLEDEKKLKEDL